MDETLILEKLNNLDQAKQFTQMLKVRHLGDKVLLQKIKLAHEALDRTLMALAFDLHRKIESRVDGAQEIKITDDLISAAELLRDVDDQVLNQTLHDLVGFAQNYENNFYKFTSNYDSLGSRALVIIAERFN